MFTHILVVEAELKSQDYMEQAVHEHQVYLAQLHNTRQIMKAAKCFLIACRAGWAAYRNSLQATRHNTI